MLTDVRFWAALAGALEPLEGGTTLAEEAGRRAGRRLVADGGGNSLEPVPRVVALLDARGFSAAAEEGAPSWTPTYDKLRAAGFTDVWATAPGRRRDTGRSLRRHWRRHRA